MRMRNVKMNNASQDIQHQDSISKTTATDINALLSDLANEKVEGAALLPLEIRRLVNAYFNR